MKYPTTLADDGLVAWRELLAAETRRVTSRVVVLDRNEQPTGAVLPVVAGAINVDATADVTRSADVSALALDDDLGFEADSPWGGAVFADRFIQIDYGVEDPATGTLHWTPVFRGTVVRYERSRPEIRLTAQGKESLMLAPVLPMFKRSPVVVPTGTRVDDAVKRIADACGERLYDLPWTTRRKTQQKVTVGRLSEPWRAIRKIAKDAGMSVFYAGDGRLTMREPSSKPVVRFDADLLVSWPRITYDLGSDFRNVVLVVGVAEGKKDARPRGWGEAKKGDPLAPGALARNGAPRWIAEYIEVDAKAQGKVNNIADAEHGRRMRQAVSVEFDALVVPGLEEGDPAEVVPPGDRPYAFVADRFGVGLGTDAMSVGQARSVRVAQRVAT